MTKGENQKKKAKPSGASDHVRHLSDPKLLEMLVCPVTRTTLEYDEEAGELISLAARIAYPVREGIPIMIPSEARQLEEKEYQQRR